MSKQTDLINVTDAITVSGSNVDVTGTVTATAFAGDGSNLTGLETGKVWVNFNGEASASIRDSFNVSTVTDLGVGRYRVNFSTSFSNTGCAALSTAGANISDYSAQNNAHDHMSFNGKSETGSIPVFSVDHDDGVQDDATHMYVACFGNQ